jgi:hypothetical protein|tara:strand:- start:23 stop:154 length:132 start_codon:yes stop_codon:yes gene_type:complete
MLLAVSGSGADEISDQKGEGPMLLTIGRVLVLKSVTMSEDFPE